MNRLAQHIANLGLMLGLSLAPVSASAADGVLAFASPAGSDVQPLSPEMRAIEVDEQRSGKVDKDLRFTDHTGKTVRLGDFLDGERPVLLTLNYYRCRIVCSVQLNNLADTLEQLDWTAGDQNFRIVTVSIDPKESAKDAAEKRELLLDALGRGDDVDWQLLTGDAIAIDALAAQLGIGYAYDAEQDQFAHPAVAMFLTPDGTIAQYLYGLAFEARDIKLALLEAGEGKIGTPMEKLYQSCFSYDPHVGRYGPFAFGIMRAGGVLTIVTLGAFLLILAGVFRRRRKSSTSYHSRQRRAEGNL